MNTSEPSTPFTVVGEGNAGACVGEVCRTPTISPAPLGQILFDHSDGSTTNFSDYKGKVVLAVNVASKCGLTPQYEALQKLYIDYQDQGFTVLGFPANNFMDQEPGTNAEIADFCSTQYAVTFPVMSKISVAGVDQHPLYQVLTSQIGTAEGKAEFRDNLRANGIEPTEDPEVLWNFEKFLVSRAGTVVGRFAPSTSPDDPRLVASIESALTAEE